MFNRADSLFFLHLPKTAGTSLTQWLAEHFDPEDRCPWSQLEEFRSSPIETLRKFRFFAGHLRPEFVHNFVQPPRTITWLRDPVARLHSSYRYLRQLDAAEETKIVDPYARAQLRQARTASFEDWLAAPHAELFHHDHAAFVLAPFETSKARVVECAIARLLTLDCFGLVERMQDSIDLLCFHFAWLPAAFELRLNSSNPTSPVSQQARALTEEHSNRDVRLYAAAVERFEQRWQEMLKYLQLACGLPTDWAACPPISRREALHAAIERHVRYVRQYHCGTTSRIIPFTAEVPSRGFLPPARSHPEGGGGLVRWTGPGTTATVFLRRQPIRHSRLTFTICAMTDARVLSELQIRVNGVEAYFSIEPTPEPQFPFAHRLTAFVYWGALRIEPGLARIEFVVPPRSTPTEATPHAPTPDSFAIREFEFFPDGERLPGIPDVPLF